MSQINTSDTSKTVSRASLAFLSGTFLSRLTGLGRDTIMAVVFGSHPAIAAFMVAFRFANLIRRLFGEGPFSSGFIPHFEQIRTVSPERGSQFVRDLLFSLSLFLILLIGGIEILLYSIWKWGNLELGNAQIVYFTFLMLPGVLFICLFGLSHSFLQCQRRFFLTGFAPAAFNGVWIVAVLMLKGVDPTVAASCLSLVMIIAFFMQWVILMPQTWGQLRRFLSWKACLTPKLFSPELRLLIKPIGLGIIGVAAVQINGALDAVFARYASLKGPAYLWYAIRIEQLPLALFGIALSTALLPSLSRTFKEGASESYLRLLRFAMRRSFSLVFPSVLAIFVLGIAGINLLYGHGDFTREDTYRTVICLWGYGFGLVPSVFILMLAPAFYAQKEFRIPTIASISSVFLHVCFTSLFVFGFHWGEFSVAFATSLAAWFNHFYLSYHLSKVIGQSLFDPGMVRSFVKIGSCALIAAIATLLVGHFLIGDLTFKMVTGNEEMIFSRDFSTQCLQFLALSGSFVMTFFSYAWMLNAEEVLEWLGIKTKMGSLESAD